MSEPNNTSETTTRRGPDADSARASDGFPDSYDIAVRTITSLDLPVPARTLAIGAHPDDVEFGCGATLAKWAKQGSEIFHLVCTDGSKGTWDPARDTTELVETRQREQRDAAHRVRGEGPGEVIFLGWVDGELECGPRQRSEVAYWIRRFRPDVILGHDPWRRYRLHPDHRNAGFLMTDAIVAARDPKFYPEHDLPPHRPSTLLLWEVEEPDHVENVAGFIDIKVAALLAHESQYESTMHVPSSAQTESANADVARFRDAVHQRSSAAGALAGISCGEAFKRIDRL